MPLVIRVDTSGLGESQREIEAGSVKLRIALAGAINDTARHEKTEISRLIRDVVNLKKENVDPHIKLRLANAENLTAKITLEKTDRLSLKYFGAAQTKLGVTYQIDKHGSRKLIAGAFGPKISRLGGSVFRRVGKKRLPIIKLLGPSAWGVYLRAGGPELSEADATKFLDERISHRLKYQT